MNTLRLGTRGSPLALRQTEQVAAALRRAGAPEPELVTITTDGDRRSAASPSGPAPLSAAGGKRLFVKAIEDVRCSRGEIDLAVHSAKDLPADLPEGLRIDAVLPREDPRDALAAPVTAAIPAGGAAALVAGAGPGARVGTSSVRRAAQLRRAFPDIDVVPVRGNVGTRLRRLDEGRCDLLALAVAGLVRLGMPERISSRLAADVCVPAPGQGIRGRRVPDRRYAGARAAGAHPESRGGARAGCGAGPGDGARRRLRRTARRTRNRRRRPALTAVRRSPLRTAAACSATSCAAARTMRSGSAGARPICCWRTARKRCSPPRAA